MLQSLYIKNIALIEELEIQPGTGLNCITGETGAGKSVVVDSIGFVLGARSYRDLIRTGCDSCLVTAVFNEGSENIISALNEAGIAPEEDDTLILSRELSAAGKNSCRINGRSVTLSVLRAVGELLIDIHGQHDNRRLMEPTTHMELLDAFGSSEILPAYEKYIDLFCEYNELRGKLTGGNNDPAKRQQRIDLLQFQISEIEAANVKKGELNELKNSKEKLVAGEKITHCLAQSSEALRGNYEASGACDMVSLALKSINSVSLYDERYSKAADRLQNISYELEDISREIRSLHEDFYFTPEELAETEERLQIVEKLHKKYGDDIEKYYNDACNELDELNCGDEYMRQLLDKIDSVYSLLVDAGEKLSRARETVGERLSNAVCEQLAELEMPGASFVVAVNNNIPTKPENLTEKWPLFDEKGIGTVEFLISANRGEPVKPVARIASGGELSRIMLAIKTILADTDRTPTLIFDEIDIGISGKAAASVAEKLKNISGLHQVLCVTHSTQIAVAGDVNILLRKQLEDERTVINSEILDFDGKIREIARLLDGNPDSPVALAHAKSLLEKA